MLLRMNEDDQHPWPGHSKMANDGETPLLLRPPLLGRLFSAPCQVSLSSSWEWTWLRSPARYEKVTAGLVPTACDLCTGQRQGMGLNSPTRGPRGSLPPAQSGGWTAAFIRRWASTLPLHAGEAPVTRASAPVPEAAILFTQHISSWALSVEGT